MWVPQNADEIEQAAQNGEIQETATFDAKAKIGDAKEVAKDIAAMANDGGVLLYGLGEDENDQPTVPQPFELKGAKEKISNWVQTCLAPSPKVRLHVRRKDDKPSTGYLIVEVPASPEAPHMVTKSRNNRFYGRNGPRNVRLGAGEIERLFQRRESWKTDREELLGKYVEDAPPECNLNKPTMQLVASPLARDDNLLERALAKHDSNENVALKQLFRKADGETDFHFNRGNVIRSQTWRRRGNRYITYLADGPNSNRGHQNICDLQVYFDGSAYLVDGNFAAEIEDTAYLREGAVVSRTSRMLYFLSLIYESAEYFGPVDAAIELVGIQGCISVYLCDNQRVFNPDPIRDDNYANTARTYPADMRKQPSDEARKLVGRLINYTTNGQAHHYFAPPS